MRAAQALALVRGRDAEVASRLRRTYAAAVAVGVRPFRDEVEAFARRARIALGGEEEGDDIAAGARLGLTEREAQVLALLAEGRTNRQIGAELVITSKTAGAHVSHILKKLGVANRAGAAAVAERVGLTRQR